jgi:fructuronate reductase
VNLTLEDLSAKASCYCVEGLAERFESPSLEQINLTVSEEKCALTEADGALCSLAQADIERGPAHARHAVGVLTALLLRRYLAGGQPLTCVSVAASPRSAEPLRDVVMTIAKAWRDDGYADCGFVDYLDSEGAVSFLAVS